MIRYQPRTSNLQSTLGLINDTNVRDVLNAIFSNLEEISRSLNSVQNQENLTVRFEQKIIELAKKNSNNSGAEFIKPWNIKDSQLVNEVIETKGLTVNASGTLFIGEDGAVIIGGV